MKKEVDIWMEDGTPKGIIVDDKFYFITDKKKITYKATLIQEPVEQPIKNIPPNKKKGMTLEHHKKLGVTYIGKCDGMRIIKELVEELDGVFHETKRKHIIRKYYPVASDDSLKRYSITYELFSKNPQPIKRRKKRHKKRKPANAVGYSKIYGTWIKPKELVEAKRAMQTVRFGYQPTAKNISKETGLTGQRVRAILDYLMTSNQVIKKSDGLTFVYNLV